MNFIGRLLVPVVVLLVFALLRRYLRLAPISLSERQYSVEDLSIRFRTTQWVVGISILLIGFVFAFGSYAGLVALNHFLATPDSSSDLVLLPQPSIWMFFPLFFGALTLAWEITLQIWALFGSRQEAALYSYWTSLKVGFDATKALRWMFTLIALPIGILTILALPMHAILGQTKIQECGYAFAPCKDYRYSDARQMTIVDGFRNRDGRLTPRAGIVIDFSDGRRWSSTNFGDSKPRLAPALEEFLENHVHLAYNYVPAEGDIPRFPVPGAQSK